jgi:murein DD-endopeptidase MepM/ murein hydrolase activator NlpD
MKDPIKNFNNHRYPFGSVSQYYGEHPGWYNDLKLNGHNGWDIVDIYGTPILAMSDGRVIHIDHEDPLNPRNGYGNHVRVFDGEYEITYGHLSKIDVLEGQQIKAGEKIGEMGNSGFVVSNNPYWHNKEAGHPGTHLHITFRKASTTYKPGDATVAWGGIAPILYVSDYNNGYLGGVNPIKFFPLESFSYKFSKDLKYQDSSADVAALQKALSIYGFFNSKPTGLYGPITRNAVYQFQLSYIPNLSFYEKYVLKGSVCGPKTREVLNRLFQ